MGMKTAIDLTPAQRQQVQSLLERYLPGTTVWAFGSRVTFKARLDSDLDLVAFTTPEQKSKVSALKEAFEESDLPFRVDLLEWDDIPENFQKNIEGGELHFLSREKPPLAPASSAPSSPAGSFATPPGRLPEGWQAKELDKIVDFLSGGTPLTTNQAFWNGTIPWVSAKDMKTDRLYDAEDHISEEGLANGSKLVNPGSVFILTRGMTLLNDVPICLVKKEIAFNQDIKALVPLAEVESDFLFYFLKSRKPELLGLVDLAGHGTGRLNTDALKRIAVFYPSKYQQQKISAILSALDDKIALNRATNQTLEQIAQALFKSWFVDFDPVHAKARGEQPVGMDADTAALFPDSFEESELGMIPKGWDVKSFIQCCNRIESGGTPNRAKNEFWNGSIKWLTSGEVRNLILNDTKEKISALGLENSSAKLWPKYSTVVAMYGATAGQVCLIASEMTANQACCALIPRNNYVSFVFLKARRDISALSDKASGSAQQNLNKQIVSEHECIIASEKIMLSFEKIILPLLENWIANEAENIALADLRDSLLPKLLSGEISVAEAAIQVGNL